MILSNSSLATLTENCSDFIVQVPSMNTMYHETNRMSIDYSRKIIES
nr:MAG TPA: hypothetical protein [Caudoviricetes sp.]